MRFLLVDKIIQLNPGEFIHALKEIHENEDYFADHFPGFPVVPGVLLIEMMAQASGKCLDAEKKVRGKAMLAQINKASFKDWVKPGDRVHIFSKIRTNHEKYATTRSHIEVDGINKCSAELMFAFVSLDQFAANFVDEVLDTYLRGMMKKELPENG